MFYLKVKKLPGAKFEKGRFEDAGFDLFSTIDLILPPLTGHIFPVGIMTEWPPGYYGLIRDRSSLGAVKGVSVQGGVIDSGWRGEWQVKLVNLGKEKVYIESVIRNPDAKAIAQVIFHKYYKPDIEFVQELGGSDRGTNWNGSSDKG